MLRPPIGVSLEFLHCFEIDQLTFCIDFTRFVMYFNTYGPIFSFSLKSIFNTYYLVPVLSECDSKQGIFSLIQTDIYLARNLVASQQR